MSTSTDDQRERLRRRYLGVSPWPAELDALLAGEPTLLEAYLRLSATAWSGAVLDARLKHLIYIAVDSVPLQFYPPGLRMHESAAEMLGASSADKRAAVAIAGLVSFEGVVAAMHALKGAGPPNVGRADPALDDLRARFASARGDWDPRLEPVLADLDLAGAWVDVVQVTWGMQTSLSPPQRELVLTAALAAAGSGREAMAFPIARALDGGVTEGAVAEAISLAAPLGMHAISNALRWTGGAPSGAEPTDMILR